MKYSIHQLDKFNTLGIIITGYPDAFEGFAEIIIARDKFLSNKTRISELVSDLNKPMTEVYMVKSDGRKKLYTALKLAIGTGITVAKRQGNNPMLLTMKEYKRSLAHTTIHDLPEMANRVYEDLQQYQETATGAGLTPEKLAALLDLSNSFREIIESTDYIISSRKAARKELKALISECILILKDELDPFVEHCIDTFPAFYNAYNTARAPKRSYKKKITTISEVADITGTVTDSVTGKPIYEAVINIVDSETVETTDEDGCYEIDDVVPGKFNVSCHAPGYLVPDTVLADPVAGETLVIDFVLVPETV
jgi:hypothetical protein